MKQRRLPMTGQTIAVANPHGVPYGLWRVSQFAGLVGTVVLVAGLTARATLTLNLFWNVVVPLLPAVFLLNPMVWRNVCPLATLNRFSADRWGRIVPSPAWTTGASVVGVLLLYVLVPARRFLFNTDGVALAWTVGLVAALAFVAGLFFEGKSGFCNGICPVLSVERLYGQRPFADVTNARCAPCTKCTGRGCIDLSGPASVAQTLGSARRSFRWLLTPFGFFAAGFPGFVYAYFTSTNGSVATAPAIYAHFLIWTAVSVGVTALGAALWPAHNRRLLLALGATAVGTYYWFAAPRLAEAVGLVPEIGAILRVGFLVTVGLWLARGWGGQWRTATA